MTKRSFKVSTFTPVAVADAANFTDAGYMAIQGGTTTQKTQISEVYLGGQAGASSPSLMILARDSTIGVTLTALSTGNSDAPIDPFGTALSSPAVPFVASTTKPQRSATLHLLHPALNTYGGICRWTATPDEEFNVVGNTASLGEVSLSSITGTGKSSGHLQYEVC